MYGYVGEFGEGVDLGLIFGIWLGPGGEWGWCWVRSEAKYSVCSWETWMGDVGVYSQEAMNGNSE